MKLARVITTATALLIGVATTTAIAGPAHAATVADGALDTDFNHGGFDSDVNSVAVQADGKIIVGGAFTAFDPSGANASANHIARLNTGGTLDTTFNHGGFDRDVYSVAVQADGKIIVGGAFTAFDPSGSNITVNHIARLNTDGTLDTTFNHGGFNANVNSLAVQADGKIIVGGALRTFDPAGSNITVDRIARLNTDGTLDTTFNHGGFDSDVYSVAVQADGKVIVGGFISSFDPLGANVDSLGIARLNTDGTLDTTFNHGGFNGFVLSVAVQPDGKIIAGGEFSAFDPSGTNVTVNTIARLNTDGTLDTTFNQSGFDSPILSVAVQPDGKIIAVGLFSAFDPSGSNVTVNRIARLGGTAPTLPPTGTSPTLLLMTALGLLAAGAVLVAANRRRRIAT